MFQLVVFKIYAIIKTSCFNWLPWTSTGNSQCEVFLEIKLNQKILKFYTSWVHWKNQCRSVIRKHALLWNKCKYQHFDIFVRNIFNPFHTTGFFPVPWNGLGSFDIQLFILLLVQVTEDTLDNWKASYKEKLLIFNFRHLILSISDWD